MIEVYLNQRKAMTLRNYVSGGERKISVSSNSSKARINSIQIWNMKSAYDEKESDNIHKLSKKAQKII